MKVETVDYVTIPTRDSQRAVAWYCDVLSGVCVMAFFKDPDGNPLTLHRRYTPHE